MLVILSICPPSIAAYNPNPEFIHHFLHDITSDTSTVLTGIQTLVIYHTQSVHFESLSVVLMLVTSLISTQKSVLCSIIILINFVAKLLNLINHVDNPSMLAI